MIKLKSLLVEHLEVTADKLSNILKNAFVSVFDIDSNLVYIQLSFQDIPPTYVYYHQEFSIKLNISYRNRYFTNDIGVLYYKFPSEETQRLSNVEWKDMIKIALEFPVEKLNTDLIKSNSNLVVISNLIWEIENLGDKNKSNHSINSVGFIESSDNIHNILNLVKLTKHKIDKYIDGESNNKDEPIHPIVPTSKDLVTV